MALGNGALIASYEGQFATVKAETKKRISFDMSTNYPSGGWTAFSTFVKAVIGTYFTIIDVKQASVCGGYKLWWDRVNDTLLVYQGNGAAPDAQVSGGTSLAALTSCEVDVYVV